jgi:hypothetical protein
MSFQRVYVWVTACALSVTASIKLIEVARAKPYTRVTDWLFLYASGSTFWSTERVLLLGAVLELIVAGVLLFSKDLRFSGFVACMLGLCFLGYRVGLWAIGAPGICPCLGHAGDWLGLSGKALERASAAIMLVLISFGGMLLRPLAHLTQQSFLRKTDTAQTRAG